MDAEQSIHSQLLEGVRNYKTPQAAQELLAVHPPLVIAGITASGKNSTTKYIVDTTGYRQVITHTTRQPRSDEVSGQDYYFISDEEMLRMLSSEAMIEAKTVHGETIYGISLKAYQDVLAAGHKPLLIIDVQGIEDINKYLPNLRPVFLVPPDFDAWT
ncbi:MAG TPA: guanylate kinase, partial [Candidatus Saccharimonadales bacterium]|nr:guanylate kinase [Candidatus Saccharimonadales bacterium]